MVEVVVKNEKNRHRSELISRIHRDRQHYLGNDGSSVTVKSVKRVNSTDTRSVSSQRSQGSGLRNISSTKSLNQGQYNLPSKSTSRNKASSKSKKTLGRFLRRNHNQREKNKQRRNINDTYDDENDCDKPSVHYPIIHFECSHLSSSVVSPSRSTSSTDYYDGSTCLVSFTGIIFERILYPSYFWHFLSESNQFFELNKFAKWILGFFPD